MIKFSIKAILPSSTYDQSRRVKKQVQIYFANERIQNKAIETHKKHLEQ